LINCQGKDPSTALQKFIDANPQTHNFATHNSVEAPTFNVGSNEIIETQIKLADVKINEGNEQNLDSETAKFSFNCARAIMTTRLLLSQYSNNTKIQNIEAQNQRRRKGLAIDLLGDIAKKLQS
jgi:hypothetical protein